MEKISWQHDRSACSSGRGCNTRLERGRFVAELPRDRYPEDTESQLAPAEAVTNSASTVFYGGRCGRRRPKAFGIEYHKTAGAFARRGCGEAGLRQRHMKN